MNVSDSGDEDPEYKGMIDNFYLVWNQGVSLPAHRQRVPEQHACHRLIITMKLTFDGAALVMTAVPTLLVAMVAAAAIEALCLNAGAP